MIVKCPESVKVHSSLKGTLLGSAAINTTLQHTSGLHHSTLHTLQWPRQWADTCPHYPRGMWCVMTPCLFPHYIIMTYDVRAGPAVPRQGKLLGRTQARSQRSLPVVVAPSLSLSPVSARARSESQSRGKVVTPHSRSLTRGHNNNIKYTQTTQGPT